MKVEQTKAFLNHRWQQTLETATGGGTGSLVLLSYFLTVATGKCQIYAWFPWARRMWLHYSTTQDQNLSGNLLSLLK